MKRKFFKLLLSSHSDRSVNGFLINGLIKKRTFLFLSVNLIVGSILSQSTDIDYEKFKLGEARHILVGMDLSPDKKFIAVSGNQSFPLYIYDWSKREVVKEFNVGNWYAGSSVRYSSGGKYLLIQQLFYIDLSINKDREVNFEVINIETGKLVKRFDNYHALTFTQDEKYIISLTGEEVAFWNFDTGKKEKSFKVNHASNGVAISPDGKSIAVSYHPTEKELKEIPNLRQDKKALKSALKYKQLISVYDAESFVRKYVVNELYDIVYKLDYSTDGKILFCLQIPHLKAQANINQRQTYISIIDGETGKPSRKGFTCSTPYEPDFKLSHDGKLFGLVAQSPRFVELHVYNYETGRMIDRFQQAYRLFEKNEGEIVAGDMRSSFVFLPDNKSVLMTMGNRIVLWNLKIEE